ncbi:hypothetical protein SISNIDRAFT_324722 [Sistotremastrum niveocremeum HHB9708]|uniref:C4-dicarboxylate transporter/malic acid transport protein n=1 Tax=Sistotremastrum niveocremeum HHB9708 TaxID=1314777 RepID=A0A164X7P8_9AGAM|nr:hypothetical protein SISNIDRAFT_324722 [Sistotremastrum niveocremeum HHB9708]
MPSSSIPSRDSEIVEQDFDSSKKSSLHDAIHHSHSQQSLPWKERIRRFTPAWFYVILGFSITALNLWAVPYNHESLALKVVSLIFWITGVIILFSFLGLTVARFYMFPGLWTKVLNHPEESVYLTCITMCFVPTINYITNGLVGWWHLFGPDSHRLLYFNFALWMVVSTIAYGLTFVIFYKMITVHKHSISTMSAVWMVPFNNLIIASSDGTELISYLKPINPSLAMFCAVWSLFFLSLGFIFSAFLMGVYMQRLIVDGFPGPSTVWSSFLPLSICTQTGFTALVLSYGFASLLPLKYGNSELLNSTIVPDALRAIGMVICLCLWIVSLFWLGYAISAVWYNYRRGGIQLGAESWAWVFPYGVLGVHTYAIELELDSRVFRVLSMIQMVTVVLSTSIMFAITLPGFFKGTIFHSPVIEEEELEASSRFKSHDA